jgi:aminodeoxyfutalosine synthase
MDIDTLVAVVASGRAFTREEAAAVAAHADLVGVGILGESARKALRGDRVTFARVAVLNGPVPVEGRGEATEIRLTGHPVSLDEARARVEEARAMAAGGTLTGFSTADLLELAQYDHLALADAARTLVEAGLSAIAETPIDRLGDADHVAEVIRALRHGGLGVWRLTVDRATLAERIALVATAEAVGRAVGGLKAFSPLSRLDPRDVPSTGYDDVKTVAIARLMCRSIPSIQVDWAIYGPKLAQVAIAYGADDLDTVSPYEDPAAGVRRAPKAEIERHIRAASAEPAERTATFELRS